MGRGDWGFYIARHFLGVHRRIGTTSKQLLSEAGLAMVCVSNSHNAIRGGNQPRYHLYIMELCWDPDTNHVSK